MTYQKNSPTLKNDAKYERDVSNDKLGMKWYEVNWKDAMPINLKSIYCSNDLEP